MNRKTFKVNSRFIYDQQLLKKIPKRIRKEKLLNFIIAMAELNLNTIILTKIDTILIDT